ncbi:MAG: hypothetical protein J6V53_03410 [Alphaproteobacteria bacterium]|nr:hypothetical protein [Alphaproteobacteria bacterium]
MKEETFRIFLWKVSFFLGSGDLVLGGYGVGRVVVVEWELKRKKWLAKKKKI